MSLSIEEKLEFLLKYAKLQGFAGISQIKEIAETPSEENILIKKLQEKNIEINYFLQTPSYNYRTTSYAAKKEKRFMLTTRTDEKGESFLLDKEDEDELFEKISQVRNDILKYAFKNDEIYDFLAKLANQIDAGTIKLSAILNCEKTESEKTFEKRRKKFITTIKEIETSDKTKIVDMIFALDFNEKTKGMIINKFTKTAEYNELYADELYKLEQIYSTSKREIIEANVRLVFSIAKEYSIVHKGILDITDIIQEGNIGLIDAVESFDYKKGSKFSSWAVWYIRRQIWTVVNSFKKVMYVPPKTSAELYKISLFEEKYKAKKGENPSVSEIAEELGLKEKQVVLLMSSDYDDINPNYELTVEKGAYNEDIENSDAPPDDPYNILVESGLKENIDALLAQIGERERDMLKLYFGLVEDKERMNLSKIAILYGLSRERVRQIIEKTLQTIKETQHELIKEWR
ncbi:MAG: sigma-70 family RNA polymerase sigma factor [Chitinivibrionia bacterium]|nr:sigma-70 family RNA polymerase sigma factor [Chitinivibrionia bacterium]